MYGETGRVIFPIIFQFKQNRIKTLAVYSTGFSNIGVNIDHTLKQLGIAETDTLPSINLNVHGLYTAVEPCADPFYKVINIIGQQYLLQRYT